MATLIVTDFWNVVVPPKIVAWIKQAPHSGKAGGRKHQAAIRARERAVENLAFTLSEIAFAHGNGADEVASALAMVFKRPEDR